MHRIGAENSTPEPSDELKCFSMLQCSIKRHIYQLSKVYHRRDFEPNAIWQITYTESICRTRGLMVLTYFSSRTYIPSIRSLSRKLFNTSLIHVNKKKLYFCQCKSLKNQMKQKSTPGICRFLIYFRLLLFLTKSTQHWQFSKRNVFFSAHFIQMH